jgi:hypothetical protein
MKTILKSILLTLTLIILVSIPAMASEVNATVVSSDKYFITAEYNNKQYNIERAIEDHETWNKGDSIILDLESKGVNEALNGEYKAIVTATYPNENNLVVIQIGQDLYSFYSDDDGWNVNDNMYVTLENDEVVKARPIPLNER